MECALATLIACFSWSGFYVDTSMQWQDAGLPKTEATPVYFHNDRSNFAGYTQTVSYETKNPYAEVALGYQVEFHNVALSLSAWHRSSIATGQDEGINALSVGMRWRPFR